MSTSVVARTALCAAVALTLLRDIRQLRTPHSTRRRNTYFSAVLLRTRLLPAAVRLRWIILL